MLRNLRGGSDEVRERVALVIRPMIWKGTRGLGKVCNFLLEESLIGVQRQGAKKVRGG